MTILFNYTAIKIYSSNNANKFFYILEKIFLDKNIIFIEKYKDALIGKSFLVNPRDIIKDKHDILYKKQYVYLASLRSYIIYKQYNNTYLDVSLYPDMYVDKIKLNPLLEIVDNKIYFKYE